METTMTMTGYVGNDIDVKKTKTGVSLTSFRLASTPRVRTSEGWSDQATTWMTVTCYRHLADNVAKSIRKGDPVVVHGRVRTQTWSDSQGVNHERMALEAACVGHDLSRGTAAFTKAPTRVDEGSPTDESHSSVDLPDCDL